MTKFFRFHKDQRGQTALETAIILIAFVVVASVFAFTILSAGSASTERGEEAIYSGLEGVQSSMSVRGAVIAQEDGTTAGQVGTLVFTVAPVSGGEPINLKDVVIGYRDGSQLLNSLAFEYNWIVSQEDTADDLLEEGELAEITVSLGGTLPGAGTAAGAETAPTFTVPLKINTAFTIEIKPPTGGVLTINRTTPAAIETVMELR